MSAPVGPTGCNKARAGEDEAPSGFQVVAAYSQIWSHVHFEDGFEPTANQQTVASSIGYFWKNGYSVQLGGGAVLAGSVDGDDEQYDIEPGWLVSVRGDKRLVRERGTVPFLQISLSLSFSKFKVGGGNPSPASWVATDIRFSVTAGYTFFNLWQLYLSPKLFGGPIFWERDGNWSQGRDRYFFQVGLGTAFLLPAGITLFAYGSPLGEQAISAGAALSI